jgi:hypothetical protein
VSLEKKISAFFSKFYFCAAGQFEQKSRAPVLLIVSSPGRRKIATISAAMQRTAASTRVARFFFAQDTKTGKMYQINTKCVK